MGRKAIRELENELIGVQAGIPLYRRGIDEFFLSHGFTIAREKLEAAKRDLEALGLYEQCCDALTGAEELVKLGPEHDLKAEMLILNATRALMAASGTHAEMSKKLLQRQRATYEDFQPDPDRWEQEDQQTNK